MGNRPVLDCKYFNKCSKCIKRTNSCPVVRFAETGEVKELDDLKKEPNCFMCIDSEFCKFSEECYELSHGYRDDGGTTNVES